MHNPQAFEHEHESALGRGGGGGKCPSPSPHSCQMPSTLAPRAPRKLPDHLKTKTKLSSPSCVVSVFSILLAKSLSMRCHSVVSLAKWIHIVVVSSPCVVSYVGVLVFRSVCMCLLMLSVHRVFGRARLRLTSKR